MKNHTRVVGLAMALSAVLAAPGSASATEVEDQRTFSGPGTNAHQADTTYSVPRVLAQTFRAGISDTLSRVDLSMSRNNAPTQVTVQVQTTGASGQPTGTTIATEVVDGDSFPVYFGGAPSTPTTVYFTRPPALTAGTTYAVVVRATGYGIFWYMKTGTYSAGRSCITDSYSSRCEPLAGYDHGLTTWMGTRPPAGDTDGDGYTDDVDVFDRDPAEWVDTDWDGVGDNADAFDDDPTETKDSDGDGVGDNADALDNDPTETKDSDGDGVGDNSDPDRDGDGVANGADLLPDDPKESRDSDGDGSGDLYDAEWFGFAGFSAPVNGAGVVNIAKAGGAIPVKFSLGADHGLGVFAPGYPSFRRRSSCDEWGYDFDWIEAVVADTRSGLKYDPATGMYSYVWKTDKSMTGCWSLALSSGDTDTRAVFELK